MIRRLALFRDRRGNATVEFAFVSLFLFASIMVALDFAFYVQQKLRLGQAVEQAAIMAYKNQVASDTSSISTYITSYAGTKVTPTVTITCNGTSTCGDGKCSCISATGTFTIAASCNATCSSNAVSGNYLKIVASETYQSVIVPDRWLGGSSLSQSAVVRLQ